MKGINDTITAYGFVLTIFVIWLHSGESLFSIIPGQIAVPGFFMMSGYLFFRGFDTGKEPSSVFKRKLAKRARTLLVPYLAWNMIYFLIYMGFGKAELTELPEAVLFYGCNPVFWYLFQLILITLLTPAIYIFCRYKASAFLWILAVFLAAVFYGKLPFHYCNEDALFYYSMGACCSLRGVEISGKKNVRIIAAFCLFALTWCLKYVLPQSVINISEIGWRASGAVLMWLFTDRICGGSGLRLRPWMKISFFVYATHYLVIRAVWALCRFTGINAFPMADIIIYLIMPAVCIATAYAVYWLMKRMLPRALSVLTGGR